MADSVEFAKDRVAALQGEIHCFQAEINRLKDYIRMSEKLVQEGWLGPARKNDPNHDAAALPSPLASVAGASGPGRQDKLGKDEDDTALELTNGKPDRDLPRKASGSEPDRKSIFRRANA
jgi:hypothetical protein